MIADDTNLEAQFIDRLYAVAMEPERFAELVDVWHAQLNHAAQEGKTEFSQKLAGLEGHLSRADTLLTLVTTHEDLLPVPLFEKLQSDSHAMVAIDRHGVIQDHNEPAAFVNGAVKGQSARSLHLDEHSVAAIYSHLAALDSEDDPDERPTLLRGSHSQTDSPVLMSFARWQTVSGRTLLLLKTIDFVWPQELSPIVQQAFTLTDAELAVFQLMAEGEIPSNIAAMRGASIATVRTQISSVYAKTSTRNHGEFMRLALGLTTLDLLNKHTKTGAFQLSRDIVERPYPRPDNRHLLTLPDGRLMDYSVFGKPDGLPCLFMHSEFFGDGCTAEMVDHAISRNLQIIAPARPHNGRSSPYPKGVKTYDQVNEDTCYLLDHLGVDQVVVLSQVMAPSIFALMFGFAHPEKVRGIVFLATLFPFGSPADESKLLDFHRFLSSILYRSPYLLKFIAKAGMAFHNRVGSKRFFATFAEGRDADLATLEDEAAYSAMANGARIPGEQGHEGYYNDYRCIPDNIFEKFLSLEMPVTAVIGDTIPRKSNASLYQIIERKDNYRAVDAVGGGQYILFSHPRLIVDCVADLWGRRWPETSTA